MNLVTHTGGCHCRAVRFEVDAPADLVVHDCNYSLCRMSGFQHLIVPASRFRLLKGGDDIACYTFNTGIAKHLFCSHCGVKPYYVPRSNPDGFSVNARCLDTATIASLTIEPFDGSNWEQNADTLAHLSREEAR